ncbi:hypothetical protein ACXR0O_16335 [Verrucomicrobiota bacterium sgz303538]
MNSRSVAPATSNILPALPLKRPPARRLRVYAFDPSLSLQLENAFINHVTLKVPWEDGLSENGDRLQPGPVGEYVEVVDHDPASDCFYAPVDLNDRYLLAQDGLEPSEGNPQFHQQMVYAVAMTTIRKFEKALGRKALWAPRRPKWQPGQKGYAQEEYVQRLRIYPHALREANAYYSPEKKALLFGYFPASETDSRHHLAGGTVFTCLSHDIVAHETAHALLDGMHRRFNEASNPDVLAFHEAFADIVALFQHFSFPEVLRHQIARTRGDLNTENLLAQLAQEFGSAIGSHGSLRDALGRQENNHWVRNEPDPTLINQTFEPHDRGSLLVAAIFDAFISIYKRRTADLLRIATNGSGVLPKGALSSDLVNRLADEASKAANHILTMCIRALDYCPPVDLTFGDYLRALITADYDLVPDDDLGYRLAVVEAFRGYGIYPHDARSLSIDSLLWAAPATDDFQDVFIEFLRDQLDAIRKWDLSQNRQFIFEEMRKLRAKLHDVVKQNPKGAKWLLKGLRLNERQARFEVHSVRPARRIGPDGQLRTDLVVEITQHRRGYFDPKQQEKADYNFQEGASLPPPDFIFRGGVTLIIDLETMRVRYYISKDITNNDRLRRQREFLCGASNISLRSLYFSCGCAEEPFALLHRSAEKEVLGWAN